MSVRRQQLIKCNYKVSISKELYCWYEEKKGVQNALQQVCVAIICKNSKFPGNLEKILIAEFYRIKPKSLIISKAARAPMP